MAGPNASAYWGWELFLSLLELRIISFLSVVVLRQHLTLVQADLKW